MLKNLNCPTPFTVFGIVRLFKRNNFRHKIRFSQAQHAISNFVFLLKTGVFSMRLFKKIVFTEAPPQFLRETKRFASVKDSSRFSALCDLPETIKKFFLNFVFFLKGFPLRKMGFLLFPVMEEWFSRCMRIPSGIFGAVKLMKF